MDYSIVAQKRSDKNADAVRAEDRVPAVVYGPDIESTSISIDENTFEKLYQQAGVSNLIDLEVEDGEDYVVLIQDLQFDPIKDRVMHADFKQIPMGQEIDADISLEFVGIAPGVKAHGGVLYKQMESVHVSCLPKDLVDHIEVDISVLEEIDDTLHVKDLEVPEGLTIQDDDDNLVVKVSEVTVEEFDEDEEGAEMGIEDIEVEGEEEELEEGEEAETEGEEAAGEETEE